MCRLTEELVPFDNRHSKLIVTPYEDLKLPQGDWALNAMELVRITLGSLIHVGRS